METTAQKLKWLTLALAAVTIVGGCSRYASRVEVDRAAEVGPLTSFAWAGDEDAVSESSQAMALECDKLICQAIEAELTAKGYAKESAGTPDFRVGYRVLIEEKAEQADRPSERQQIFQEIYVGRSSQPQPATELYTLGTVIVEMTAPNRSGVFWRGSTSSKVHMGRTTEERRERINAAVAELLSKFPNRVGAVVD